MGVEIISNNTNVFVNNVINTSATQVEENKTSNQINSDTGEISVEARQQYEYSKAIKGDISIVANDKDRNTFLSQNAIAPTFLADYAKKYAEISKDIIAGSSSEEAEKKLNLLNKAYNDAIKEGIESLANDFQNFFDYAAKEWVYDKNSTEQFQVDTFKSNLKAMADTAFTEAKNAIAQRDYSNLQEKINQRLSQFKSGDSIETMGYEDIKAVDNFLKTIPNLKNHIKEYFADGTYKEAPANWSIQQAADAMNREHQQAEEFSKSGVSGVVGKYVQNAVNKNLLAFHKNFSFGLQMDAFQGELNKDDRYYKLLKSQQEEFERALKECRKKNHMKTVLIYLDALKGIEDQLKALKEKRAGDSKNKDALESNPNSVVDCDAFKALSNALNFKEDKVENKN